MADLYASETTPAGFDRRRRYELLRTQLWNEQSSFLGHWRELADNVLPRRYRFVVTDTNRGNPRNQKIIDCSPTMALRTLRSGMMAGITSPARDWFLLTTGDTELNEVESVKTWLSKTSKVLSEIFGHSNLYNCLPILYGDMGLFGTGAMIVEEDFDDVIRFNNFPLGSYCIANDDRQKVRVFFRIFRMTVRQLVMKFGRMKSADLASNVDARGKTLAKDNAPAQVSAATNSPDWGNFSQTVRSLWENGNLEAWIDVCHVICPNEDYDPSKLSAKFKKYESVYYELGTSSTSSMNYIGPADQGKYLRESGYDYFPVLCGRWETAAEDVYGTDCPGMTGLGDIRQLHLQEKRGSQAIEKKVNPPMVGPSALKSQKASILPGDITFVDEREGQKGFRSAHEVNLSLKELEEKQTQIRQRIDKVFFVDLFLMFANDEQTQPDTAAEVYEKAKERMLALGPVLEQLNQDILDPLIDIAFMLAMRQGKIPPIPKELNGVKRVIKYTSILQEAQKLVGVAGIEKFMKFVGEVFETTQDPGTLDNVDVDATIDLYGNLTSVPPGVLRAIDKVQELRKNRAAAQQQQAKLSQAEQAAGAAKNLAAAKTSEPNALTDLMEASKAGQVAPTQ